MKRLYVMLLLGAFSYVQTMACTSLLAGKKATTDGSTFITYAADSHTLYGELYYRPAKKYPSGSMLKITDWDSGKPLGEIPQVDSTYAVVGHINEFQLSISESTFGGRAELEDTTGVMDYGSLIFTALQRARTAREAIGVMTDLVKDHGYFSSGESFSIADPNEVWIMEMIGKGRGNKGAVWVAMRIPDDCISAHANQSRIRNFPLNDNDNCLYSPDVISFAREKGYFSGLNKDFSFADAYAPLDFSALRACEARVWSFFRKYSSDMDSYLPYLRGENKNHLPLYIKPNRKLSLDDMKEGMRDHFEGTPFDMTTDVGAGPFKVPYRFRPMTYKVDGATYVNERAIATQQTGFSFIIQMRSWLPDAIGGINWFGVDDANTCVYVPLYCSITNVPECFREGNGDMYTFSWTSAFWIHNWVANMAYARYNRMIPDIRKMQQEIEGNFKANQPEIEKKALALCATSMSDVARYLTDYSIAQAQNSTEKWKKLGEYILVKFLDGNEKKEVNGKFKENGYGQPDSPNFPGYSEDYYKSIVKETGDKLKVTF